VTLLLLAIALAGSPVALPAHWRDADEHRAAPAPAVESRGPVSRLVPRAESNLSHRVYGYAPHWVDDRWLRYDLLTHIGIFDVTLNPDGSITNSNGFPGRWAGVIDRAHRNGVKCEMVATCFGWSNVHGAIRAPAAIPNLVNLALAGGVDGINMDFEEVLGADRDTLVLFMQALSRACRAAGLELTMATMPLDFAGAYDFRALADTTDGLFIMGYNFHWQGGPEAGPVAPLTGWPYYGNLQLTINEYLSEIGDARKLYFGLPYYGYQWPTYAETTHSATAGYGEAITFAQAAGRAQQRGRRWDTESQTPWYAFNNGGWNQGWCDDDSSLLLKYAEVHEHDFLGAGMWALGYDGSRTELWAALREAFNLPLAAFENGGGEDWRLDTIAAPFDTSPNAAGWHEGRKARHRRETSTVRSGGAAIAHYPDSLGFAWPALSMIFQDVSVVPGAGYELSGWCHKNDGLGNRTRLRIEWRDSLHRIIGAGSSPELIADSAGWRRLTTGSHYAPGGATFARLCLLVEGSGGRAVWDDIDFSASTPVADRPVTGREPAAGPTLVRGVLHLPSSPNPSIPSALLDASGRKALDLRPGGNDISHLAPGVYFVRTAAGTARTVVVR
jgi:hypothetical protein